MAASAETALVALDWGTSALRAYRIAPDGTVLETRELPAGVQRLRPGMAAEPADFARAFEQACGDWRTATPGAPAIACGMVGSAQGWREVPYLDVPTDPSALAGGLARVEAPGGPLWIVPGLRAPGEIPGVLRGEETQLAGMLDDLPAGECVVGLPGTHAKWARVAAGRILAFDTFMTGEVFEALAAHTILARTLRRGAAPDLPAFDRGVAVARSERGRAGLLATAFGVRTLGLGGTLGAGAQADYLSGLVIGHELRGLDELRPGLLARAARIVLAGAPELCERYRRALAIWDLPSPAVAERATERGLWRIAVAAGLLDGHVSARASAGVARAEAAPPLTPSPSEREPSQENTMLDRALETCGLIAILRGIRPTEAADVGAALYAAGIRVVEVPLNSPEPAESIRNLRRALPADCVVGAGTVLAVAQVAEVRAAGGQLVVMPHADAAVIRAARAEGLWVTPGVATPTEAFAALAAGATALKLFPAEALPPAVVKAWRAVLPPGARLVPVGGITAANLGPYLAAGAAAFGIGSAVYRPGATAAEVGARAAEFVAAWRAAIAAR
jgi:2-dehydro-3-deoxygalactonokinase